MKNHIEALIFAADAPLTVEEIQQSLQKLLALQISTEQIDSEIQALINKYEEGEFAFTILPIAGGYQFFTKTQYEPVVADYVKNKMNRRLSTGQLETLSIIGYKQPISKSEIEQIRGVNCDYAIQKLLEKELIQISGRSEGVGKPIIYSISNHFLNYFGLKSTDDLPKLKDMVVEIENSVGANVEEEGAIPQ
jgi:segregation and condensation protein B